MRASCAWSWSCTPLSCHPEHHPKAASLEPSHPDAHATSPHRQSQAPLHFVQAPRDAPWLLGPRFRLVAPTWAMRLLTAAALSAAKERVVPDWRTLHASGEVLHSRSMWGQEVVTPSYGRRG